MINIEIIPIKKLYHLLSTSHCEDNCAIVTSSYAIDKEKLHDIKSLTLQFDDIKQANSNSFNENMAHQIHEFVKENSNSKKIYICCDSGESRSPAIAAATYKYLGENDNHIWKNYNYHPNEFVYKLMCKEYRYSHFIFKFKT